MHQVDLFFLLLSITSAGLLVTGLFRPWVVLWWEDVQNRKKVIKVYGLLSVISLIVHFIFTEIIEKE